jgi:hypothetical protein
MDKTKFTLGQFSFPVFFLQPTVGTVDGQIKLGPLKFNLCKSDYWFVNVYIICHTKVNLFVIKP